MVVPSRRRGGLATVSVERLDAFGSERFPCLVRLCGLSGSGLKAVALLTIVVQGSTLGMVARRTLKDLPERDAA